MRRRGLAAASAAFVKVFAAFARNDLLVDVDVDAAVANAAGVVEECRAHGRV